MKENVDSYLCFVSPKSGGTIPFMKTAEDFKILKAMQSGIDQLLWMK